MHFDLIMPKVTRKSFSDTLECPICHELLKDARSLLCGHVFCKTCLDASRSAVGPNCPLCRRTGSCITAPIPIVNQLVEALENEAAGPSNACEKHPPNEKKFVCTECMVSICSECAVFDHYGHNNARPVTIEELAETLRQSLKQMNDWQVQQTAIQKQFDEIRTEGTQNLNWIKNRIHALFEMQVSEITKEVSKMIGDIEEKNRAFIAAVDTRKMLHANLISVVSEKISRIDRATKRGQPEDIISATTASKWFKNKLGKPLPVTTSVQ